MELIVAGPRPAGGTLAGPGISFDLRDQPDQGSDADVGVRPTSFAADFRVRTLTGLRPSPRYMHKYALTA